MSMDNVIEYRGFTIRSYYNSGTNKCFVMYGTDVLNADGTFSDYITVDGSEKQRHVFPDVDAACFTIDRAILLAPGYNDFIV